MALVKGRLRFCVRIEGRRFVDTLRCAHRLQSRSGYCFGVMDDIQIELCMRLACIWAMRRRFNDIMRHHFGEVTRLSPASVRDLHGLTRVIRAERKGYWYWGISCPEGARVQVRGTGNCTPRQDVLDCIVHAGQAHHPSPTLVLRKPTAASEMSSPRALPRTGGPQIQSTRFVPDNRPLPPASLALLLINRPTGFAL